MRPKVATFGNFFVHSALVRCHLESTWFWNWYTVLNIKWCSYQYLTRILFPIWVIIQEMSCKLREMWRPCQTVNRTGRIGHRHRHHQHLQYIHDEGDKCSIIHVLLSIAVIFFSNSSGVGAFNKNYYIILVQCFCGNKIPIFSWAAMISSKYTIDDFSRVMELLLDLLLSFVVKTQGFW